MAEIEPAIAPAEPPQLPGAAPEPTPSPTPPAGPTFSTEQWEKLQNDYIRTREDLAAARETLRLTGPQQQPQQAQALTRLAPQDAQAIAQQLGWTVEQVQQHVPIFAAYMSILGGPFFSGVESMADIVDLLQARSEIPKYETAQEEVDRFRAEMRQRGQIITRKQAYSAVMTRRMQDPKYMDEFVANYQKEKAQGQQQRAAQAQGAVTEGATVQKAGPEPTKQARMPQTKEEFEKLPIEEMRRVLEGVTL